MKCCALSIVCSDWLVFVFDDEHMMLCSRPLVLRYWLRKSNKLKVNVGAQGGPRHFSDNKHTNRTKTKFGCGHAFVLVVHAHMAFPVGSLDHGGRRKSGKTAWYRPFRKLDLPGHWVCISLTRPLFTSCHHERRLVNEIRF